MDTHISWRLTDFRTSRRLQCRQQSSLRTKRYDTPYHPRAKRGCRRPVMAPSTLRFNRNNWHSEGISTTSAAGLPPADIGNRAGNVSFDAVVSDVTYLVPVELALVFTLVKVNGNASFGHKPTCSTNFSSLSKLNELAFRCTKPRDYHDSTRFPNCAIMVE